MKLLITTYILSLFILAHSAEEDFESKCPCFCFNSGPFYRRVNRAQSACDAQPKSANCIVVTNCRRNGRVGAACCEAAQMGEPMCPCRCRSGRRARQVARAECENRKALCVVQGCGRGKNGRKWQCCDRRGGKQEDGDSDGAGDKSDSDGGESEED